MEEVYHRKYRKIFGTKCKRLADKKNITSEATLPADWKALPTAIQIPENKFSLLFWLILKFIDWIFSPFTTSLWIVPLSQFFMQHTVNLLILQLDNLSRGCCEEWCPNLTNIQKNYNHCHLLWSGIQVNLKSETINLIKKKKNSFSLHLHDIPAWFCDSLRRKRKGTACICLGKACIAIT